MKYTNEMIKLQHQLSDKIRNKRNRKDLPIGPYDSAGVVLNHSISDEFIIYGKCDNCDGLGRIYGLEDSEKCNKCNGDGDVERPLIIREWCQKEVITFLILNSNFKQLGNLIQDGDEIRIKGSD